MSSDMPRDQLMMNDLFAAARDDAPSGEARDMVWGRVAAATSVPTAVVAAKAVSTLAPAKLVAIGAAIGAAGVAIGAIALTSDDAITNAVTSHRAPSTIATGPGAGGARLADPMPRARSLHVPSDNAMELPANGAAAMADTSDGTTTAAAVVVPHGDDDGSALAEEARLVTEARAALMRGEPERALALSRSTRKLGARVLEPEELRLEARALAALGRTDEAIATELTLRRRFPGQLR